MAELAVSFARDTLLPLVKDEVNLLRGIHKDFAYMKDELESIQAFLKDADTRAAREGETNAEGVKKWVEDVRKAAFRIEDVIDDYMIHVAQHPRHPGCAPSLFKIAQVIKTLKPRDRLASEIQDIKSFVREIKERRETYCFQPCFEQGSSSSTRQQNAKWYDPRLTDIKEAEFVGFEAPKEKLLGWLVKGRAARTVVSLWGMGGQGKTTLAKKVYDNTAVVGHFECRAWITVSQSYSVDGLLRDMLCEFYKSSQRDYFGMDRRSLTDEVRNYLKEKRYVIVFDDVWNIHFWNEIESAVIDNNNGSRIFITTRNKDVAESCKKSSFTEVHELQALTQEESRELFNKKAFQFDYGGICPKDLVDISSEIVRKCQGLPLAIVVIGGLLSTKEKNAFEWKKFAKNLYSELKKNSHLIGINEILSFSYEDLPCYLKSCLLYFGIYPEDYHVESKRLTLQWIAEGFVKEETGKSLEEVAEGYLTELIHRSLVQVSSYEIDGKCKACHVHDQIRMMILGKFEDLRFCKNIISEDGQSSSSLSGRIRRVSIATISNDLKTRIESSHLRSLFVFLDDESSAILDEFVSRILTK